MASYLCALTADSGLPLFNRRNGALNPLPFATIGVLNGVHMFSHLQGSVLKRAVTPEEKILWRTYHNSVVLILVTRNDVCDDLHLENLLDNVFASMAMLIGLDNLTRHGNIEKLKRELKVCFPLIDYLLNQRDEESMCIGDLTQRVDVILFNESQSLVTYLEKYLEVADSAYGCLLIHGKIVIASKHWWSLASQELVLLSALLNSLPKSTSHTVPVYLPVTCPRECNRLLTLQLLKGIELCVLCGSEPALSVLEDEAPKIWKGSFELLKSVTSMHPRNFPANVTLDQKILGFLLINRELNQSVCSLSPTDKISVLPKEERSMHFKKMQEAVRTLYKQVIGTHFVADSNSSKVHADGASTSKDPANGQNQLDIMDFYLCTELHKCYAISSSPYEIFIVFNDDVPRCAMRSVAHKTLKALTTKKLTQRHCAA